MSKNCAKRNNFIPIYVECYEVYRFKVCVQELWHCLPRLDIQNLSYLRSTILHETAPKKAVQNSSSNMKICILFFSVSRYEPMAEWLRLVFDSVVTLVQHCAKSFCSAASVSRDTEPDYSALQCTDTCAYCRALYNFFWILSVTGF